MPDLQSTSMKIWVVHLKYLLLLLVAAALKAEMGLLLTYCMLAPICQEDGGIKPLHKDFPPCTRRYLMFIVFCAVLTFKYGVSVTGFCN